MTEKLKTLKEFNTIGGTQVETRDNEYVDKEELRKEAIKWYKGFKEELDRDPLIAPHATAGVMSWIKMFFNLTTEDLK